MSVTPASTSRGRAVRAGRGLLVLLAIAGAVVLLRAEPEEPALVRPALYDEPRQPTAR